MMQKWIKPFLHLFFPRYCVVCGRRLREEEQILCMECDLHLPRTNLHRQKDNMVEQLFWGKIPIERGTAFYYYHRGGVYTELVHQLKYQGRQDIGTVMGRLMAYELAPTSFFDNIHSILPVPLHKKRFRERGYNQSECLARGVSEVTGIPIDTTSIARIRYTATQTHKSAHERYENMQEVFRLQVPAASLAGRHILLMDDVLTTSATLTACADALKEVPDLRISILALALSAE